MDQNSIPTSGSEVLREASDRYGIDASGSLTILSGGYNNAVYGYRKMDREYILRVTHHSRRTRDQIQAEIDWLQFLSDRGLPVCRAIPSRSHQYVETVTRQDGSCHLVMFEKAKGAAVDVSSEKLWNPALFHRWGRLVGAMHAAAKRYAVPKEAPVRPAWTQEEPDLLRLANQLSDAAIQATYRRLLAQLQQLDKNRNVFGLIHNDFHQGNFTVTAEQQLSLYDFDDCAYYWFAQDLAVSFYHAYWQFTSFQPAGQDFGHVFIEHLFEGYSSENQLDAAIVKQIPVFLKLREIVLYALFSKSWDRDNMQPWQSHTLRDLRARIVSESPYSNVDFSSLV